MKVTNIKLNGYLNFADNFEIDLRYPVDHLEKPGQPLDKICFIGQSGTGKTTLLNLVKLFSFEKEDMKKDCLEPIPICNHVEIHFSLKNVTGNTINFYKKIDNNSNYKYYHSDGTPYEKYQIKNHNDDLLSSKSKPWLINFPFNVIEKKNDIDKNTGGPIGQEGSHAIREQKAKSTKVWDFSFHDNSLQCLSDILLEGILKYNKEYDKITDAYHDDLKVAKEAGDTEKLIKLVSDYERWKEEHDDIFKDLAKKCLNPILKKFNLEVSPDMDLDEIHTLESIDLQHINTKEVVPDKFLSTGIHQLLKTAIPLHFLTPTDTIILFDQAETSLYPDVQSGLIQIYTDLAPNCQLFFATHSPIVASGFEPCEIFELYFNPEGKVNVLRVNERHKKFGFDYNPQLLSWDSIYVNFFGVKSLRPPEGMKKLRELALVEKEIKEKKEKNESVDDLIEKYKEIAKSLDWNFR